MCYILIYYWLINQKKYIIKYSKPLKLNFQENVNNYYGQSSHYFISFFLFQFFFTIFYFFLYQCFYRDLKILRIKQKKQFKCTQLINSIIQIICYFAKLLNKNALKDLNTIYFFSFFASILNKLDFLAGSFTFLFHFFQTLFKESTSLSLGPTSINYACDETKQ